MKKTGYILLTILISIIHILPFYLLLTTSFKPANDFSSKWVFPSDLYLENFTNAWKNANLGQAFLNNIIVTFFSLVLIIIIGAIASYPLSRFQTKLNKVMYAVFISAMIVPPLTTLVPLYQLYVDIGAMNTYWGIILLQVTFNMPITIFLYTGFIGSIPRELDEAAMIDGMSRFRLFFKIILPLLKPITATVIIMTGVGVWNDYQFSLFFLQKLNMQTVTVALSSFFTQYSSNVGWVAAGSLLAALPLIVLYLFLQRYFVSGLSSGAVKG
ncbi:carbohydrate ABC transporter permease [Paenibacillus sp. M1]|uniref:Carbohydrate ABC transporter permease n=1 Tax=Paenibacillus haidiansis TaxID=1574488 RepID=A0ABU7VMK1_9BACL